jgi:hypothetical protein
MHIHHMVQQWYQDACAVTIEKINIIAFAIDLTFETKYDIIFKSKYLKILPCP